MEKHPQSYIHGVERWITNRSERVIACSYYMREQIADIFGVEEEKVAVIPNGIDPDDLQPSEEAELKRLRLEFAEPEEKLVVLIGRLVYEKGFQLALEALPGLIERLADVRFVVAGSGTHEQERPIRLQGIYKRDVRVGHNCWIGYGACILRGVTVGDNAIIGTSTVVTKDVPANSVVAGAPARILRMRDAPATLRWG